MKWTAAATVVLIAGLARAETAVTVGGLVVGPDSRPVAGATVWLDVRGRNVEPEQRFLVKTGADGRFAFPQTVSERAFEERVYRSVCARDAQGRVGWLSRFARERAANLRIELLEPVSSRCQLADDAGKAVVGAAFRISSLSVGRPGDSENYLSVFPELRASFAVSGDADGDYVFTGLPRGCVVGARISAASHSSAWVQWVAGEDFAVPLERGGVLTGAVKYEGRPPPAKPLELMLQSQGKRPPPRGTNCKAYLVVPSPLEVDAEGRFTVEGCPVGRYRVVQSDRNVPAFYIDDDVRFEIKSGETTHLQIVARPCVSLRGRVVDAARGAGVAGAEVKVCWTDDSGTIRHTRSAVTDAHGNYRALIRPGRLLVAISRLPESYLPKPTFDWSKKVDVTDDCAWPPIEVSPAVEVPGIVVDERGQPVAGADVIVVVSRPQLFDSGNSQSKIVSGSDGTFTCPRLDPNDTVPFRARTQDAVTDGAIIITPRELTEPLRLVVSEKNAFRLRGRVADQRGKPIAGASVRIVWKAQFASRYSSGYGLAKTLGETTTDAEGRFESGVLWPKDEYTVEVFAEGYVRVRMPAVTGVGGTCEDIGAIVLRDSGRTLVGRVLNAEGKPVPHATVFNSGDGYAPARATTDLQGRFKLERLFDGPVWVCVERAGYRFTARRFDAGAHDVTIKLVPSDAPPPASASPAVSFEEQKRLARALLERLWETPGVDDGSSLGTIIACMARIDPETALEWTAQIDGRYADTVRAVVARQIAARDADQAITLLADQDSRRALRVLVEAIKRLADSSRDKALRLAEEALARARALDEPDRTRELARIGTWVVKLGRERAGRALIEEAAAAAGKLATGGSDSFIRIAVARAIAPFDRDRALKLANATAADAEPATLGHAAIMIAPFDFAEARAIVDRIDTHYIPDQFRRGVAYFASRAHPAEAIEYARGITSSEYRALTLGWLAEAVAERDRKQAWSLIDEAIGIVVDDPAVCLSWGGDSPGRSGIAAFLAIHAKRVGYPDLDRLVRRAISLRPTPSMSYQPHDAILAQVYTAALLAEVDPGVAAQLLRDLEPRWKSSRVPVYRRSSLQTAFALADPRHACELAAARLDKFDPDQEELGHTGVLNVVSILTTPPDQRRLRRWLFGATVPFWYPDEETR